MREIKLLTFSVLFGVFLYALSPVLAQDQKAVKAAKVVGGRPADPGEYPFMVALMFPNRTNNYDARYCGGALIDPEWVLTAAHCLEGTTSVDIGLGFHDLSSSPGAERIASSNIYLHPDYFSVEGGSDIALIQLSSPANGYQLAQYATSEAQNTAGTAAIAIGWGALSQGGEFPTILQEVDVPLVASDDCNAWGESEWGPGGAVLADMLCAGYREGGRDTCQGDSGGPLFYYDNGVPILVGATSWGEGCAKPDFPGIYARVSYFAEWIEGYVGNPNITPTPSPTTDPNATATPTPTMTPTPTATPVLMLDAYEPDDEAGSASVIADGDIQTHSILPAGNEDWLTFTLNSASAVSILTDGTEGDTTLALYDSVGNQVAYNDDGGANTFSLINRTCETNPLPPGTYTLLVDSYSVDETIAAYTIALNTSVCTSTPEPTAVPEVDAYEPDETAATAGTINSGDTQTHSIFPIGDQDWLTFTLTEESNVTIVTEGAAGNDTRLYLYNSAGDEIGFDDDGGTGTYSLIERTCAVNALPAGTYTVLVDEYGNDQGIDQYDISLSSYACLSLAGDAYEGDDTAVQASSITSGAPQSHSIYPAGDQDWATFTLSQPAAVTIATTGNLGDTRLYLYDSGGDEVGFDDDGGAGLFSIIERECEDAPLPAGTYTVLVDEYGNDAIIENYQLAVTVSACTPDVPLAVDMRGADTADTSGWHLLLTFVALQIMLVVWWQVRVKAAD